MRGITSRDETIREITHRETRRKQNESRNRFLSLPFHPWIPDVNGQVTITSFENTWHFIHKDHDFPMRIRFWTFIYRRNLSRYTTNFLEFCFLPILLWRIFENFPTYVHFSMTGSPSSLSLFLSLSSPSRKKRWNLSEYDPLFSAWSLSGEWKHWPPIKLRGYPACRNWREAKKRARGI